MYLSEWIDVNGRGARNLLAAESGVSRRTIYRVLRGHRPSVEVAIRISEGTGGVVSAAHLLRLEQWPS